MLARNSSIHVLIICFGWIACAPLIYAADGSPESLARPAAGQSPVILTPPAPATPRINGPHVFGVRPGNPLIYTIPATGQRPMMFSADSLPQGLSVDAQTGRFAGAVAQAGRYMVTLHAKNSAGEAKQSFTIVVGDEIALTPPLGWNSYNCWANAVDQDKVLRAANAMARGELMNHGWSYINIDDGWQGARGGPLNAIQPNSQKFPDVQGLCDQIHQLGLKVGIYSTPWVKSYGGKIGGSAENSSGAEEDWPGNPPKNKKTLPFAIGKYSFARQDAKQWSAWGIDYLKYDWGPVEPPEAKEMSDILHTLNRDIVFSVSNNHVHNIIHIIGELSPWVNSWRTTTGIADNWKRVSADIGFNQDQWNAYIRPGHYADADMLVVGYVGWGSKQHPSKLTPDEQYTHISLWCLLSSPLLLGCDLERLDPFTLSLLTNDEVLSIDQDALAKPPKHIALAKDIEVYVKELEDGTHVVGVFNRGGESTSMNVRWSDLELSGPLRVRDLWRQSNLGEFAEQIPLTVTPHGVMLLKVTNAH